MNSTQQSIQHLEAFGDLMGPTLRASRIPGIAVAVVATDKTVFAKGFGWRDLEARLPMTSQTIYPIASTTKAINATLLGMLVEEGKLAWDTPVQRYLPAFRLLDPTSSAQATLRDLVTMRTGLPRHDWVWTDNRTHRADLIERLRYLEPSAGFRERFQYNNLTVTAAGHIAEVVTGRGWEELVRERILEPLGMYSTSFGRPESGNVTLSYHETTKRELRVSRRPATEVTAPSGGSIHSTVEDMARWIAFNLNDGTVAGRSLIKPQTLAELHRPQVVAGLDPTAPTPHATYGLGWFLDVYNGCPRLSHGGLLHRVNSNLMFFPRQGLGMVSFSNFASSRLTRFVNQQAFDLMMGFTPEQTLEEMLARYEAQIESTRQHNANVRRVAGTSPSHPLDAYTGSYVHPAYGRMEIHRTGAVLTLVRNTLTMPLEHWHYDSWVVADNELFEIHAPHAFDRASRVLFDIDPDGQIAALSIRLEPAVAPIRFAKS